MLIINKYSISKQYYPLLLIVFIVIIVFYIYNVITSVKNEYNVVNLIVRGINLFCITLLIIRKLWIENRNRNMKKSGMNNEDEKHNLVAKTKVLKNSLISIIITTNLVRFIYLLYKLYVLKNH